MQRISKRPLALALAALAACGPASAAGAGVPAGDYVYVQGGSAHGGMTVRDSHFTIETVGANLHTCELDGTLAGDAGTAGEGADACHFKLRPAGASVNLEIDSATEEACRSNCGARGYFFGEYRKPSAECTDARRAPRLEQARRDYRSKSYDVARTEFGALVDECRVFFDRFDIDRVRNDLAVAAFQAGDPAQCLAVLADTIAARAASEDDLMLPPADLGTYRPIARSTWHNQALCKGAARR